MKKKHFVLVIGLAITCFALWYTTRGIDWREFGHDMQSFNWLWMIPALATFYFGMYLRAIRWGMLFLPHHKLSGAKMFPPVMICFAFNSILPGRVGEVARAVYVGKRMNTGISTAIATVVAERIFDGVCLLGILAISLMMLHLPTNQTFEFGGHTMNISKGISALTTISLVLTCGVIVFMIPFVQLLIIKLIRKLSVIGGIVAGVLIGLLVGPSVGHYFAFPLEWSLLIGILVMGVIGCGMGAVPHGIRHKLEEIVGQFARGFHALANPLALVQIVAYSVVIWVLCGISNWCVGVGFGLDTQSGHWTIMHACALMTLIGIFILIPAAPGYWGLYEAGGVFSLITILHVTDNHATALAYTLMIHLVQYIPIVIIGLIFAAKTQVSISADEIEKK